MTTAPTPMRLARKEWWKNALLRHIWAPFNYQDCACPVYRRIPNSTHPAPGWFSLFRASTVAPQIPLASNGH
ncbi:uncharacterized protein EI90DRAFT_3066418 [Cantharellus anzutake]|uniref:uncharacterized protein n=1 Tax=Cantharellus anzutake TaxID=1750568 RepID=UPI001906DCFF|nr:uncharacterized protein EI90DRAFT_3066418 [Cantharellus anzutake]KAF8327947.1 hypothetical protein EI90DRAFT_3066418 [Cantharellus anzutake]